MARRPAYLREYDPLPEPIERHMDRLGFWTSRDYYDWCRAQGFAATFDKHKADLQDEWDAFQAIEALKKSQMRLHKTPRKFLEAICKGEVSSDDIYRPNFKRTAIAIEESNPDEDVRASLLEMLLTLLKQRHDNLIFDAMAGRDEIPFVRGLIKLHDRKPLWLQDLTTWKPRSKNAERKFGDLTHHLFDQYGDVPGFLERSWLRNDRPSWRYRDWYVHLGRGYNLRTAKTPITVTKRIAHEFLQAPDDFSVEQAVRFAQLRAFGADRTAVNAAIATRLGQSFEHEAFWVTVLRFIAENPMLDPRQIGPIIDYLQNQKFETFEIEVAPGQYREEQPPQPGLSMRGRRVDTLIGQVEAWHRALGKFGVTPGEVYQKASFDGLTIETGKSDNKIQWSIRQLRSARDLQVEGRELNHCVASYHRSCARGDCTIWSLSRNESGSAFERCQTIEVDAKGTLVQCRGNANRDPTTEERKIVMRWASDADLVVSPYL